MDAEGNPVFSPAPTSDAFAAEMERYPLKVVVEGVYDVKLYPGDGETTTILNVKRGIISALAVPLVEEDKIRNMPTIHGKCKTHYSINAREDIATDINLDRDLSRCDKFVPMRDHTSPLALISGMHYPLAQLVRSSQSCNYKFDNEKKYMTSGSCTEKHILIPFSHKGEYGVTNVGKQELTLIQVSPHNNRVFDRSDIVKGLHMEAVEDKSVVQDKDAGLNLLRELANLPETEGERRAHLFHKLVTMVRGMKAETLSPAIPEAIAVSRVLTYQVLAQCGTPECSSAIMQILRTLDSASLEVDAAVFALGLMSNPSALLINDLLEMAKYKSSKPIMYALSNVVKRFYKAEGKLIPEIHSVAEFMGTQLGDCSGDKDNTFMTLRVIGNMAPAMAAAGPALRAGVIQCVNQPAASLAVQQAAIQVFRLTLVPEEGREVLMQVLLDSASPMQKRIAAYLVLMKDPQPSELAQLAAALPSEQDKQVKSFVISHITNILSSTAPETEELRQKIHDTLQGNEIGPIMDPFKFSRNYKVGSVEGNMIFEGSSYLPKEVMLEMTLKAFGYDIDMMEIGMEGKGFEPTVDALFGENGFFPDTALKTMYFVSDNMPLRVNEFLQNMLPALKKDRMKRQASQNLMREIGRNLNKLVRELKTNQSPEAMVYLRLLGNELGYLRTNEMEEMAYSAAMMIDSMFKMFPSDLMKALMTKADNTIFAHYIFMDNEFFLPTVTGVPLRIALSGTFTPGIKGGLKIARDMSEVAFMPSAGIEFVTQVGSHIPEFVNSGLEMHTNIFHESGLSAKISMDRDNVKLTIPAPMSPTKLIKMTNSLVAVTGSEVTTIPPVVMDKVDVSECTPVFAGMKYCTALQYTDAFSQETAPYFPFTGDSKFAVELHPTGEVTEYTATVAYELLREGEEGRQKVDSVKFILRAEGADPTEARAIMKYNRRKNVITADIQIPDYDVEAGLRLGVVDGNTKGKGTHSISLDLINKNIPQLSLVGRANLKAMKEGMLQVQLLVPSLNVDATVTANIKRDEEMEMQLKSEIKFMEATSEQKIAMKYDASKIEVEFKSDVKTEAIIMPIADVYEKYGNQLLDTQVGQTDMKVRHIFKKFVEAANNYMERYGADIPYIQNFRVPDMPEISLPETLFLNTEAKAVYHFNNERFTIAIPLPLGGKSTEELNFPPALTTPSVSLPQFGLEIISMEIPIPELVVPESLTLSIPLFGKAEVSTLMKSNLYDMEASMAAGKDVVETPSYSAMFAVKGTSPFDILSMQIEASEYASYTHDITINLKPYTASANANNNLKFLAANFINKAQLKAELYKMDLTGSLKAIYGEEEITHTYQDVSVYNTAERTGVEVSGTITNILNTVSTDNQEFTISGFLKYDKNTDSHMIQIPLFENLPVLLESIKGFVVRIAEVLQDYINNEQIRAKLEALPQHIIADVKLNRGTNKVIGMDVNENLAFEASLSRVYAVLKYTGNNEANVFNFNTNGKHIAQATIDFAPMSSLAADIEIDISQPSSLGELTIFENTVAEVTPAKQKISTNTKFVSPLYTTNLAAEVEGNAPMFKVTFKSSATSVIVLLEYDLDSSITINFEQGGLSLTGKGVFTHTDLTVDIQHIFSHTWSDFRLTLNVDITSPAFTGVNLRHVVHKDGISATISIPSTGFLGLQLHGRVPSQMNARLYGRYAMSINMDAPDIMLSGLKEKLPAITSCLSTFAEKYQLFRYAAQLKNIIIYYIEEAHNTANNHAPHMSQVSILFRNTVVQYQRTVQVFLDAVIKVLRETQVKLPGSDETTTLIEVLNKLTTSITTMLEKAMNMVTVNVEYAFDVIVGMISKIQVTVPVGDIMAGAKIVDQIRDKVKTMSNVIVDFLKHIESLDMFLDKLGDTLKFFVDKTQDFVDNTLKSDVLDAIAVYINALCDKHWKPPIYLICTKSSGYDTYYITDTVALQS
ncbi:apolipoprotein B-100-like protein [Lates japonicus]|uniref:Apolipoprotein B-100-like protein n=1 Tax=Lates japonicus TaxID=270547 RepID=A0AAD3M983_LATJO|nr:apolipoprotein B-100-like protein [Lates japonicus]